MAGMSNSADLVIVARLQNNVSAELKVIQGQLNQIINNTKKFGSQTAHEVQRADTAFKGLSQTLIKLGAALGGLYAFRLAFREIVQPAIEFDQALRQIWTITDATWGQMQKLGSELRHMAKEFGKSADEVAWGFYEIKSSGFEGADALKVLEASIKGAAAGLASVNEVADVTTSILNAWGMSADKATYVNDILFKTVDLGKVKIHDLAQEFGRLAGIAAPLGVGLVELAAAVSTLTIQGVQANEAVTAIRQAVIQLAKPTKTTAEVIRALGYESGAAMVQQLGFAQALAEVTQYAEEHNIELTKMFTNIRAVLAILPLATTSAATYAKHQKLIAESAGKVDEAFGKMAGGVQHQINLLRAAVTDLEISIAQNLVGPIVNVINLLTSLADALGIVASVASMAGSALSSLLVGGGLWKLISKFFPAIAGVGAPIAFSVPFVLQLMADIKTEVTKPPQSIWQDLGDAFKAALGPGIGAAVMAALMGASAAAAGGIGLAVAGAAFGVTLLIKVVFDFVKKHENEPVGGAEIDSLKEYLSVLQEIETQWLHVKYAQQQAAASAQEQAKAMLPGTPYSSVPETVFPTLEEFKTLSQKIADMVGRDLADSIIKNAVSSVGEDVIEKYKPVLQIASETAMKHGFEAAVNKTVDALKMVLPQPFKDSLPILLALFKDAGSEFAQAVLEGLGIKLKDVVKSAFSVPASPEISLPGLAGTEPVPMSLLYQEPSLENIQRTLDGFSRVVEEGKDTLQQAWESLLAAVGTDQYKEAFSSFWNQLRESSSSIEDLVAKVKAFGQEVENQPQILRDLYSALEDTQQEYEALVSVLKFFGLSTEDAEAAAEYLASALGIAGSAAESFAERLASIRLENLSGQVGQLFKDTFSKLASAFAGQLAQGGKEGTLGPIMSILSDLQSGAATIQGTVESLERIYNSTSDMISSDLKEAARRVHDSLVPFTNILGKTDEEIAREQERARREAEQAARRAAAEARRAAQEAERAAQEAARRAQQQFREQFNIPIEEAISTGDWLKAAQAIRAFAQSREALFAQAKALPAVNGETIKQADVLQLITGAYRRLQSALENQIEILKLAGEDASALEKMKEAIDDLLDPLGILKRRLRELVDKALKEPVKAAEGLRQLAFGSQTGLKLKASWEKTSAELQAAVKSAVNTGIVQPLKTVLPPGFDRNYGYQSCSGYPSSGDLPHGLGPNDRFITNMKMLIEADPEFAKRFWKVSGIAQEMATAMQDGVMTQKELNTVYQMAEGDLSLVADAAREVIDAFEQEIEDRKLFGMEASSVRRSLERFKAVLQGTTPLMLRFQDTLRQISDAAKATLQDAIHKILKFLLGPIFKAGKDAEEAMRGALNVPTGYKVERQVWRAARPGEPYRAPEEEDIGQSLLDLFLDFLDRALAAFSEFLAGLAWENFISPINWADFIYSPLWGTILDFLGWDAFISPVDWWNYLTSLDWSWFINPINWPDLFGSIIGETRDWLHQWIDTIFGGMASQLGGWLGQVVEALGAFLSGVVDLVAFLLMLGSTIGWLEGVFAILVGAIQGIADLIQSFLQPILHALGEAWQKLKPLIDAVREAIAALSPVFAAMGEVIALGIDLMTDLFAALAPVISVVGQIINLLAQTLAPAIRIAARIFEGVLRPAAVAVATALQGIVAVLKPVANAFIWLYNYVLRPIINIGITFVNALIGLFNAISNFIKTVTLGAVNLGHIDPLKGLPELPYLQEGGRILHEGLAYLHSGETVVPAQVQPMAFAPPQRTEIHTHLYLDGREIAEVVHEYENRSNVRLVGTRQGTAFRRR